MSEVAPEEFRILVVDDEQEVLDALALTLRRAKNFRAKLTTANDPLRALEVLERERFHLVLADYRMPNMNGVELLKTVRERWPETVRALVTGYSDVEIAMEAMDKAKIHYYVQKPWNNDELRLTVYEALKGGWSKGG
ncbi:MAG TPA: response regulator [Candidatus Thermoplasmatota archaeon]|nr:response regulator [Candidatus Thermoplasmatota archaeon]